MLTLKVDDLKLQTAEQLRETIDTALSAMLYPNDDPSYREGGVKLKIEHSDVRRTAYDLVAIRYLWFLYKKATIPGHTGGQSPGWFDPLKTSQEAKV